MPHAVILDTDTLGNTDVSLDRTQDVRLPFIATVPSLEAAFGLVLGVLRTILRHARLAPRIGDDIRAIGPRWGAVPRSHLRRRAIERELHALLVALDDQGPV